MFGIGKKRIVVRQYVAKTDKELNKKVEKDANKLARDGYHQISVSRIDTLLDRRVSVTYELVKS